jgi:lycopene cyclase domain-containing protein
MKEYTLLSVFSVFCTIIMDRLSRINILKKSRRYFFFLIIIFLFKLLVNGFLTGSNIVIYNKRFFLGLRLGSIPLEDFLFGFSMITMTIIFWEYFRKEGR